MVEHEGSLDHQGEPEAEAIRDILAMGSGDLKDFTDQVRG
jgi:hypothetical protein